MGAVSRVDWDHVDMWSSIQFKLWVSEQLVPTAPKRVQILKLYCLECKGVSFENGGLFYSIHVNDDQGSIA